ncbi:penicillin-binding transpeptidase domain-containing protein [Kutzneria albida]|uniref:Penicillin-binding protein transpeptidase domain-containing protein n=1 Tax=Kutzneria albida DSM 43870 TaxID=1449976 RepID=W5W8A4_9PSEU|nr:penicillin-binding transpeptidase domain-containing protein [Kutzneria albida]AHH97122.1 hypothetical protein KALB_3758 [Kutzneria albida DSM 43870]
MQSKTRRWILGSGGAAVLAIIAVTGYLVFAPGPASRGGGGQQGVAPVKATADSVATSYLAAFSGQSTEGAAALTDDRTTASAALAKVYQGMGKASLTTSRDGGTETAQDGLSATARFGVKWTLPGGGTFSYQDSMQLRRNGEDWQVHWSDALVHPDLTKGQSLALRTETGKSSLLDRAGKPVTSDSGIPAGVLQGVRQEVGEVNGTDGWRVVAVDSAGADGRTLQEKKGSTPEQYTVTIDARTQKAAQDAVSAQSGAAAVVALSPAGEFLAVATNSAYDARNESPLTGLYTPGSTFKIVTATAALEQGQVSGGSTVSCPPTITIGQRTIPNDGNPPFGGGAAPDYSVSLRTAFALSCNTTFSTLASKLDTSALPATARQLGIGVDFTIPGVTTNTGSIKPVSSPAEQIEDGFGQGTDTTSPFGLAVLAATVQSGKLPTPTLIRGKQTQVTGQVPAPSPGVLAQVRQMMRDVCTTGTAKSLAGFPGLAGKTGTAEVGAGQSKQAHGWFVGYREGLAFAVLMPDAGTSHTAVDTAGAFLRGLG